MMLAIDIGNSNIVFGIFSKMKLIAKWRMYADNNKTEDEYACYLVKLMEISDISQTKITGIIISCVVPRLLPIFKELSRKYFHHTPLIVGDSHVQHDIKIMLDRPLELGADLLTNAIAAYQLHNGANIIVDFGTVTTFTLVDNDKVLLGGAIAPGFNSMTEILGKSAAKLPDIQMSGQMSKPDKTLGTNTIDCIQSGIYWGYISSVNGIIGRLKEEFGKPVQVIATGGLAHLVADDIEAIDHMEKDLTLLGLRHLYELNNI